MFRIFNILFLLLILLSPVLLSATEISIKRSIQFTNNKFLTIDPSGDSLSKLSDNIKPSIVLKGASDEEEKIMLAAFFGLGYDIFNIYFNYNFYPLDYKIANTTVKGAIIANLRELRELLAIMQAKDETIESVQTIIQRISIEDPSSTNSDQVTTKAIESIMYKVLPTFVKDYYGLSYQNYYYFGIWDSKVLSYSEMALAYDSLYKKNNTTEYKDVLDSFVNELKELIKSSSVFKNSTSELTKPAVSRNLDNLTEIASEMKSNVTSTTIKRIYDHSLNVYYAVIPEK